MNEAEEATGPYNGPHFRVSIKQTAKGPYQLESTSYLPAPKWPEGDGGKTAADYAIEGILEARRRVREDLDGRLVDEEAATPK